MGGNVVIEFDFSGLLQGKKRLESLVDAKSKEALEKIADELLRLSSREVPLDTGQLMKSGKVETGDSDYEKLVGYNKVYASRLHEHPEYNFKNGRKGKYLEDPLKNSLNVFKNFYNEIVGPVFK